MWQNSPLNGCETGTVGRFMGLKSRPSLSENERLRTGYKMSKGRKKRRKKYHLG